MSTQIRYVMALTVLSWTCVQASAPGEVLPATYSGLLSRIEQLETQVQTQQVSSRSHVGQREGSQAGCRSDCGQCAVCRRPSGFFATFENVIVKPHFTRNTAFLIEDPAPVNDGYQEVPFDWDFSYSPRIELGYANACGDLGVRVRYWQFDDQTRLIGTPTTGPVFVAFTDDSSSGLDVTGPTADVRHSLKLDVLDLETVFRQSHWLYSAGVRYARMEQTYTAGETIGGVPDIISGHNFEGFGLSGGAEFIKPWRGGLSLFAKTRSSLLFGQSGFRATNPDASVLIRNVNDEDLLGVAEMQLGVDWRRCIGSGRTVFATAALEAQYWINAGTGAPMNNAPFDEGNYQNALPQDADLGFFGGSFGLGLLF